MNADFRTWSDEDKAFMKYGGALYGDAERGIPARYPDPPGIDKPRPMPPDSMGTSSSEYVSPLDQEITLKRMKERNVCAVDKEYIRVADTLFTRLRGEKLFRKIERQKRMTPEQAAVKMAELKERRELLDTTYHDLMLDLRDERKYKAAVDILGDTVLRASDCPGIYLARILGKTWKRIGGEDIKGTGTTLPCADWIRSLDEVWDTTRVAPPKKNEDLGRTASRQTLCSFPARIGSIMADIYIQRNPRMVCGVSSLGDEPTNLRWC